MPLILLFQIWIQKFQIYLYFRLHWDKTIFKNPLNFWAVMKHFILKTLFQTQQHSEGKAVLKSTASVYASDFRDIMVPDGSTTGSKRVDLICPAHTRFSSSTRQALQVWGLSCSDLLCHFHTKDFHIQKRSVTQCFSVFYQEIKNLHSVLRFADRLLCRVTWQPTARINSLAWQYLGSSRMKTL